MKPKYVWNHKHQYWRMDGRIMGAQYLNEKWLTVWVEPEDGPLCWYPEAAGRLATFGCSHIAGG